MSSELICCLWLAVELIAPGYQLQDDITPEPAYGIQVGYKSAYVWGSYEAPGWTKEGQTLGDITTIGAGIGARHELDNGFGVFAEYGYYEPTLDYKEEVKHEAVTAQLRSDRSCEKWQEWCGFSQDNNAHFDVTDLEIDGDWGWRVGVRYRFVTLSYRSLTMQEFLIGDVAPLDGHNWQERNPVDLSYVALGLRFEF